MPFLKVHPGEAVAVRIINEAGHDAASTVTVDGLSMFTFRDDKADKNEHVIVKANDLSRVNRAFFTANGIIGIGLFGFALLDLIVHGLSA